MTSNDINDMEKEKAQTPRPDSSADVYHHVDINVKEKQDGASEAPHAPAPDLVHTLSRVATAASELRRTETRQDGSEYPSGLKLTLITIALCLAVFLMALDNSIIATAIPKITDQFHSLDAVGWYGSAYLLTTAALQLLFGKFYSYLNIKWVFLSAIGLFELGSLICGVAPNSTALIIGRAIAGAGSAGILSGALIILAFTVPLRQRPAYAGGITSMYGIASVAGPLLGGVFTDKATWRWCFYINLPIGAITVVVVVFFFQPPKGSSSVAPVSMNKTWREILNEFDPVGTVLFMPAIVCLLLALQWGGTTYTWNSGRVIALFVVFGVLISAFLFIQWRQQDNATIPPRIIKMRTVWSGATFSAATGAAFFSGIYFLPLWFQAVKGSSAVSSGIMNLPLLIAVVLFSLVAGIVVSVLGYYTPFMLVSTVLTSVGYGLISTFRPDTGSGVWIGYQIIAGAGVGFGMQQPLMAVQAVLSDKDLPTGTAVIVFTQTLGGSLFVSVSQNVFSNKLVEYVRDYAPGLEPSIVLSAGATSIQKTIPAEFLDGVTLAYNDALMQTFLVSAALAAVSIVGSGFMEWKSVKGKKVEMAMA
ncbi:MFS sugar transporter [Diaporthe australafricana]|uniref:MFS sugar transporter n=1 Tax=Diaporthe australafricana TaxID=127596 RepID=A0ABR3W5C1_9PEZI